MKKVKVVILTILVLLPIIFSIPASANMAAPRYDDVGTTITFKNNDDISVTSEVLDIVVNGTICDITATYHMKNTSNSEVKTASMFISPNIVDDEISVIANNERLDYKKETYYAIDNEVAASDWELIVLHKREGNTSYGDLMLQTISFDLSFRPEGEYDVLVSYKYNLGGYPERYDDLKRGSLTYYLMPAKMWKDFSSLAINLYLDSDMPVIAESSLDFNKVEKNHYQYRSNTLPDTDLRVELEPSMWQKFIGFWKSPYLGINLFYISIPALIIGIPLIIVLVIVIVFHIRRRKQE